ncbi:MAG: thiamine-phosphate kinase, partial [Verrucomicrobia bacterium]|nr:thiamine-phosphate kinase [Verrucomicrobiota bacterium]
MKTLRELGEGGFIALLKRRLPRGRDVLVGIGDDCAAARIARAGGGKVLLLK